MRAAILILLLIAGWFARWPSGAGWPSAVAWPGRTQSQLRSAESCGELALSSARTSLRSSSLEPRKPLPLELPERFLPLHARVGLVPATPLVARLVLGSGGALPSLALFQPRSSRGPPRAAA